MKKQFLLAVLCLVCSSKLFAQSLTPVPTVSAAAPTSVVTTMVPTPVLTMVPTKVATSLPTPVVTHVAQAPVVTPQDQAETLSEVVVTANREETPLQDVPNSMTVITADEMERKQENTAFDALQDVPGLNVTKTGGSGETSSIYTRGGSDGDTLTMIDGIPLNDPTNTSRGYDYLDQLSLDGFSRIEVVRGNQSTLYGSNATAGVINLITEPGNGPSSGSVLFGGGSYGTFWGQAAVQGGDSKANYSLTTSQFSTAGYPSADKAYGNVVNNPDSDFSSLLRLGIAPEKNFTEDLIVRYSQSRTNIDDGAGGYLPGDSVQDDPNNWVDQQQFLVGSNTKWTLDDWTQSLILSFTDNYRYFSDLQDSTYPNSYNFASFYDGQTAQITWQHDLKLIPEESLVFGVQGHQEWSGQDYDSGSGYTPTYSSEWQESGFLQSQTHIDQRLFVNLGGRWDNYNTYGSHATYQLGGAYLVPELETKLKATYGTGFTAPTLYQLYAPSGGNASLQPETSAGYDYGFEQPIGKDLFVLGATGFHNEFDNQITWTGSQYLNQGNFQTQGVETSLMFKAIEGLTLKGEYTHTDIMTNVPLTSSTCPLFQKPTDQAGLDIDYQWKGIEVGTTVTYVSSRPDYDFTYGVDQPVTLNEYYLVNLRASYQVDPHVKLFARVDNLFNEFYEQVYGYGTPGLSAYGGTKISF